MNPIPRYLHPEEPTGSLRRQHGTPSRHNSCARCSAEPPRRVKRASASHRFEFLGHTVVTTPLTPISSQPDTFLAKAAAPNAALARTDSDALWQRNGGEVSTSGAAGRVSLYAQDGSGRSAALRSLIASSEQGNAAAIRELLESFPQPKSLASAIRGRPGAPDHGHGGGWRKAVHWAFDRTSQSASTTIPPGSSSSPADEAIASLIAFGAALELSVNDEGSAEFWERGTDGYAEANAGRVTDWLTDTSREDRMRRLFLCTAAASLAAERTELLRETTAQAKRIRQLEAQLELKRREAERLKEELGATQQREREAVAAAAQLEQPGAGAEELLRKMILAAGVRGSLARSLARGGFFSCALVHAIAVSDCHVGSALPPLSFSSSVDLG